LTKTTGVDVSSTQNKPTQLDMSLLRFTRQLTIFNTSFHYTCSAVHWNATIG